MRMVCRGRHVWCVSGYPAGPVPSLTRTLQVLTVLMIPRCDETGDIQWCLFLLLHGYYHAVLQAIHGRLNKKHMGIFVTT